ncbi:hypothetical protein BJ322DRAFT_1003396 [Thelephora terrestris]|uniref:Uncharacterized protein n=1 Tax=Thelephora terrestris TaxID=56493 RepID=A0A9P6L8H9_9AGAM|nr:hypothetical protein BJ322DRAFT_1003396 [Thelephora terrestris]
MFLQRFRNVRAFRGRSLSSSATSQVREFKVVLDGQTLYIEKPLAEALGWNPGTSTEGVSLRLSGWEPKFFAITPTGTDSDLLAQATVESSNNPQVQQVLSYLKQSDSEP